MNEPFNIGPNIARATLFFPYHMYAQCNCPMYCMSRKFKTKGSTFHETFFRRAHLPTFVSFVKLGLLILAIPNVPVVDGGINGYGDGALCWF